MTQIIQLKATNKTISNQLTDSSDIQEIFSKRMSELDYITETDSTQGYDITVQLACKEQITLTDQKVGKTKTPRPKTLTQSPPCIIHYLYEGQRMPWQCIERVVYAEGIRIARSLDGTDQKHRPTSRTIAYLEKYEFPLLLAAEWNHIDRLVGLFMHPKPHMLTNNSLFSY